MSPSCDERRDRRGLLGKPGRHTALVTGKPDIAAGPERCELGAAISPPLKSSALNGKISCPVLSVSRSRECAGFHEIVENDLAGIRCYSEKASSLFEMQAQPRHLSVSAKDRPDQLRPMRLKRRTTPGVDPPVACPEFSLHLRTSQIRELL
jgi:hypothetical protein